jgi:hypothetical protein
MRPWDVSPTLQNKLLIITSLFIGLPDLAQENPQDDAQFSFNFWQVDHKLFLKLLILSENQILLGIFISSGSSTEVSNCDFT